MQVNALLSALIAMPGSTADFFAATSNTQGGAGLLGLNNSGAKTAPAQNFTGILNNKLAATTLSGGIAELGTADASVQTANPTGDITPSPQDSGIAIPPLTQYIDSPVAKSQIATETADSEPTILALANGSAKPRERMSATELADIKAKDGKIDLSQLETASDSKVDEKLFAEAVSKLVQKAKKPESAEIKPFDGTRIISAAEVAVDAEIENKAVLAATESRNQIEAKILGVKELASNPFDITRLDAKADVISRADISIGQRFSSLDKHIRFEELTTAKAQEITRVGVDEVHVKISQALNDGFNSIKIKLFPEELGQIDVDMSVDNKGNTSIRILADRAEALDALRKDSHNLERTLRDMGVKTDSGGMEFSLRGGQQDQQNLFNMMQDQQNKPHQAKMEGYIKRIPLAEQEITISAKVGGVNIIA